MKYSEVPLKNFIRHDLLTKDIFYRIKKRGDLLEFLRKMFEGKEKEQKNTLFIIFLIGILLITFLPKFTQKTNVVKSDINIETSKDFSNDDSYEGKLEQRLEKILSDVEGAGDVEVMIVISKSSEIIVSEDLEETNNLVSETDSNNGIRTTEQVTTKKSTQTLGQNETPLILTELVPEVSGVIIVSEGAGDIHIKDSLIRSVSTLLEIPSYKVEVLQKRNK